MQAGAITGYIDVAQIALYAFWIFFAGLIFYLRKEDKREGYPLVTERPGHFLEGFPAAASAENVPAAAWRHGDRSRAWTRRSPTSTRCPSRPGPDAPLQPVGNAMLAGVGPAASALRADTPDLMNETGELRIVPLRVATDHYLDDESPDPRTMQVVGADGVVGGVVSDIWIDRAEAFDSLPGGHACRRPFGAAANAAGAHRYAGASCHGAIHLGQPVRGRSDACQP